MDPAKLKVVELRAELSKRGLDTKGVKAALVKRLKEALEEELKQELPDTSIADTSTEELDSSQSLDKSTVDEPKVSEEEQEESEPTKSEPVIPDEKPSEPKDETTENKMDTSEPPSAQTAPPQEPQVDEQNEENNEESKENGEQDKSNSRKSRWSGEADDAEAAQVEENNQGETIEAPKTDKDAEPKGEKRRRSSPSPDRSQRRRSKSPIKEDEPPIDTEKVQLSWYDSDLHLQVDKESFLSAKPYHDGAFGFAWAGVRATHGVNTGKVCFEVKITEELKWEDFSKYWDKHRRDQRPVSKHKSEEDKKKDDTESKEQEEGNKNDDTQQENGDKTSENDTEVKKEGASETVEVKKEIESTVDIKTEIESTVNVKNEPEDIADIKKEPEDTVVVKNEPEDTTDVKTEPKEAEAKSPEPMEQESQEQPEKVEPVPTHIFRVGWSLINTALQLGEDKFSYGYESSGRFVADKQFQKYGISYGVGDVITSFLNIDENTVSISYAVNGESQSEAVSIPLNELPENFVLFPHVLSRNYAFELNLGSKEEAWFAISESYQDYQFLDKAENKVAGPFRPENRSDCEVILMCGLPASGKTHWVQEYVDSNPDKKYTILGNTHLLSKMTVSGDPLKTTYKGSWSTFLEKLQKCLNRLVDIAALRRRNYIIDQPNVFPSAQRRKLRPFEGFKRRAVVVVVGEEEQAKRQSLQEAQGGKDVPDHILLEMKANMSLPQKGEWIDEVIYAGVDEEEAKTCVQKFNSQARETIGIQRRFSSHRDDRHRWQNRRNDYRGGNYRDRQYQGRYDRGPPRQNWHPQRPGGWNRDRRDQRGPPMGGNREWRNRGNSRDRGNRDNQVSNYNRNRNPPNRGPGGNWPSNWSQGQSGWGGQQWGGQGSWNQGGNWSQSNQNQWKYGGGNSQGYGNYGNWNYYGQYPQNWGSPQGQTSGQTAGSNYGQYSQQDWAQYAQQYAQQGQTTATTQSTPQK